MKIKLSRISALHYYKLIFRSLLFLATGIAYIVYKTRYHGSFWDWLEKKPFILAAVWLIFAVEMILRFFPSSLESMGCQKVFRRNYVPVTDGHCVQAPEQSGTALIAAIESQPRIALDTWKSTFVCAVVWLALNGAIGAMYFLHWIDEGILLLVALAYSICDMICILFFCPFQTWFMKNKCCTTCRIYNWDFAMMFTPLVFIPSVYTWTLLGVSLGLLFYWEATVRIHPEHFMENTNANLHCANCQEKLCHHKKQLKRLHKRLRESLGVTGQQQFPSR